MIDGLKPYPAMKDSGVPWLGEVPEHWQVLPAFAVYRPRQIKNTGLIEKTVLSLSYGRIIVKPPEKLRGLVPESFETYQIVDPGNIIVRTTDLQNDQTSLRVGHAHHRGIITAAYMCLETKPVVSNDFGYQYLNTYDLLKILYGFGSGLRQNLDFSDIKRMPVLVPPLPEQAAIVRFLDHADRRIRRYIRAKQKLIKLLEEQKQAIIHRAVTRGLDPNVRLKPSGVQWLGDVPEHWEVSPLSRVLIQRKEKNHPVKTTNILSLSLKTGVIPYAEKDAGGNKAKEDLSAYMLAYPGDIVVNSMNVVVGSVGLSRYFGAVSPVYYMLRPRDPADAVQYFSAVFRDVGFQRSLFGLGNGIMYIESKSSGKLNTIRLRIPMTRLKKVLLPRPPSDEQAAIVEHLDEITADIAATLSRTEDEVHLLREYRTRLIADVVTGKLDVREAAARLPDEIDEPEPLDEIEVEGEADDAGADDTDEVPEEAET
jgi:type I restriction enzyme S subunit